MLVEASNARDHVIERLRDFGRIDQDRFYSLVMLFRTAKVSLGVLEGLRLDRIEKCILDVPR